MSKAVPDLDFSFSIKEHLARWGLRPFSSEASYSEWQRQAIVSERLQSLADLVQRRQGDEGARFDVAFYDLAASPDILPVVYSQRYGYYVEVGVAIVQELARLASPVSVLDVGCGVGILTTWYAATFPHNTFRGIDRSAQSVTVAQDHAANLNLANVEFIPSTLPDDPVPGSYDVIICTQALFQSEIDPGLPSQNWRTFERTQDLSVQLAAEQRTGIGQRLDCLLPCLKDGGLLLLFEKTLHLGRRVLFQRGLSRRGFSNVQKPRYLQYSNLEETERDGPLYVVSREHPGATDWDELPHTFGVQGLYCCAGEAARFVCSRLDANECVESWPTDVQNRSMTAGIYRIVGGLTLGCIREGSSVRGGLVGGAGDEHAIRDLLAHFTHQSTIPESFEELWADIWPDPVDPGPLEYVPVYENHTSAAQRVWAGLVGRQVVQSETSKEEDGRARHIELGECTGGWVYLYWANTYDQRQLVIMDPARKALLLDYYGESVR